jgi:cation diffusion facilitator CzcD-associated flavoprotein CzcO
VLALPIRHGAALEALEPAGPFVRAVLNEDGVRHNLLARRVVLATGRAGAGGVFWPDFVDHGLVPDLAAHTNDDIDFAALRGKSIAILGGGASAWDNAATALERGAARVDMYVRRPYLPQVNKGRGSAFPGFLHGWSSLPDAERWATMVYLNDLQAPVPHETVNRTTRLSGFYIHFRTGIETASRADGKVAMKIAGQDETRMHDFLVVGTGFNVDPRLTPELASYASNIATWYDRYQPSPDLRRRDLERFPYLGPGFELTEKTPGSDPTLGRIHLVNFGAHASHAGIASDIPGVNIAAERVAGAIVTLLFTARRAISSRWDIPAAKTWRCIDPAERRANLDRIRPATPAFRYRRRVGDGRAEGGRGIFSELGLSGERRRDGQGRAWLVRIDPAQFLIRLRPALGERAKISPLAARGW